jgi:hypothetical protein
MATLNVDLSDLDAIQSKLPQGIRRVVLSRADASRSCIPVVRKLSIKLSNGANMTRRGSPTTTSRPQGGTRHNMLVLAQGIEP